MWFRQFWSFYQHPAEHRVEAGEVECGLTIVVVKIVTASNVVGVRGRDVVGVRGESSG